MREWLDLKHGSTPYTTSLDEAKDNDESGAKQQDDSETDSPNNDDHDKDKRVRVVERECLLPVVNFHDLQATKCTRPLCRRFDQNADPY